jgi:hypothetical protein
VVTLDHSRVAFLRELTRRHENLVVWKHLDRSLHGHGDVDAVAPEQDVGAITQDAVSIAAATLGATHAILCDHVPSARLHFFVQPHCLPQLFELDIWMQPSRGSARWADPRSMVQLAIVGMHGIRQLRPGAEAIMVLVYQGLSWKGHNKLAGDEREIVERGLADDLQGAYEACRVLPPRLARSPLLELVGCLRQGAWSRRYALQAFGGFALAGLAHPEFAARRGMHRAQFIRGRECLMFKLMRRHRRQVPSDGVDALLDAARAGGHDVSTL